MWVLVARIENEWRLRRLAAIAAVASVGLLFANTVIFVGAAAMASLALECLVNAALSDGSSKSPALQPGCLP